MGLDKQNNSSSRPSDEEWGGGGEAVEKKSFRPFWPQFGIKIGGGGFAQRFPGVFHIVLVRYEAAVLGEKMEMKGTSG